MNRFIRMLRLDMKRAFSRRFLLAALLIAVSIILDNADAIKYNGHPYGPSVYYYFFYSISFGGLYGIYLMALLCAIPYSTGFLDDYRSHFLVYAAGRTNKRAYLLSKYVACIFSSGSAACLGTILLICFLTASGCPPITESELALMMPYMAGVKVDCALTYYLYAAYFAFLRGSLWGSCAVCVSTLSRSIYFTLASPFVASFLLAHGAKTLRIPNEYRFDMLLNMRCIVGSEAFTALLCGGIICAICVALGVVFYRKGTRFIYDA